MFVWSTVCETVVTVAPFLYLQLRVHAGTYAASEGSYTIYSDDAGKTWQRSSGKVSGGECQVAPTDLNNDNNLIIFSRLGGDQRGIAFSSDGGETWQNDSMASGLSTTPCEGSIVAMHGEDSGA